MPEVGRRYMDKVTGSEEQLGRLLRVAPVRGYPSLYAVSNPTGALGHCRSDVTQVGGVPVTFTWEGVCAESA